MNRLYLLLLAGMMCLPGCATVSYHPGDTAGVSVPGAYHEVKKGETLWGIARMHGVDLSKVIAANRMPDESKIEVGQLVFIPAAREKRGGAVYSKSAKSENFIWPVRGEVVLYYGSTKSMARNKGIDIRTRSGADVVASRAGRVTFTDDHMEGYGKTIIIDHLDGFQTVYAHNAENLVAIDERVKQGQVIARAGKTGRVNRPTLHFEIRKKHKPQNPFYYLP